MLEAEPHPLKKTILQRLSRHTPWLTIIFALGFLFGAGELTLSHSSASHYEHCIALAAHNPEAALADVKGWLLKKKDSPLARHCEAVALYNAKSFTPAAEELETLASEADTAHKPQLAVSLLLQAVTARRQSNDLPMAINDVDHAIILDPANPALKSLLADISGKISPASGDR